MRPRPGGIPSGEDYFPRSEEAELWRRIEENSAILIAPRRSGKSTMLNHMKEKPASNWQVYNIFCEDIDKEEQIRMKLASVLVNSSKKSGNVLIILDEFQTMIVRMAKGKNSTRKMRELVRALPKLKSLSAPEKKIRFVYAGSKSFDLVARKYNLDDSFKDLPRIILAPLSRADALRYLTKVLGDAGVTNKNEIPQWIYREVGCGFLYFLAILADKAIGAHVDGTELTDDVLEELYEKCITGAVGRAYFQHNHEVLKIYKELGGEKYFEAAEAILGYTATHSKISQSTANELFKLHYPHAKDWLFQQLMLDLESDFYLRLKAKGNYEFQVHILGDWWGRYYPSMSAKVLDVLLIWRPSGILISHLPCPGGGLKGADQSAAQLTATYQGLRSIEFEAPAIQDPMGRGTFVFLEKMKYLLVCRINGKPTRRLDSKMRDALKGISKRYPKMDWDGDRAVFDGIEAFLKELCGEH
ncbi:MAG: AAA family ATPase [Euryarchaeota archaeon]|nr:AAA family ATPase [Euryarchaeota archaeon]